MSCARSLITARDNSVRLMLAAIRFSMEKLRITDYPCEKDSERIATTPTLILLILSSAVRSTLINIFVDECARGNA